MPARIKRAYFQVDADGQVRFKSLNDTHPVHDHYVGHVDMTKRNSHVFRSFGTKHAWFGLTGADLAACDRHREPNVQEERHYSEHVTKPLCLAEPVFSPSGVLAFVLDFA